MSRINYVNPRDFWRERAFAYKLKFRENRVQTEQGWFKEGNETNIKKTHTPSFYSSLTFFESFKTEVTPFISNCITRALRDTYI